MTNWHACAWGFLGLGWIGLNRLKSVANDPRIHIAAAADPSAEACAAANAVAPEAVACESLAELLKTGTRPVAQFKPQTKVNW